MRLWRGLLSLILPVVLLLALDALSGAPGAVGAERAGPRAAPAAPAQPASHTMLPPPTPPAFYWVETDASMRQASPIPPAMPRTGPAAALPDLSVQWIERTPRYQRFCLDYSSGLPDLCPGTENLRRFPLPGEIVSFTARIANQGAVTSPVASALWELLPAGVADARAQTALAIVPPLPPGVTTTLTISWPWQSDRFTVSLTLDPALTFDEITRQNNRRSDASDALYLDVLVHPLIAQAFAVRFNLIGSYSFQDWIQAQFDRMNANLAAATYTAAPAGILDRVRIDVVTVTEQVGGDQVSGSLWFDGRWTFRVETDDPDTPENEAELSAQNYAQTFASTIDWGLIHELTHQLGVIDLYNLNVAGSYQNAVVDGDGRPLLLGFSWPRPGLMGGGDVGLHTAWRDYSDHTALALNRNQGQRRGYFGEYLFDTPASSTLRVLDNRGQPLAGAQVALYQTAGGVVGATPVASGSTDAAGRFALPNRGLPLGGVTTATGHTLVPNPFGQIGVVGFDGQLLAQVSQGQQQFYAWWPLTDFNLAYWQGSAGAYERTLSTHLPAAAAPAPPPSLDGLIEGVTVNLTWTASPSAGIVAYRVYRGQAPDFYPFSLIATTTATVTSLAHTSFDTARYAVTAVDGQGRESGFSPIFRAQRTVLPAAAVVNPTTGERVILDGHDGALVTQLADDRWVGRQGSVHLGLAGARALVRTEDGQLLAAVTGENRLKILDAQRRLIAWFGQEGFVSGPLQGPAGAVLASAPLTITLRPAADGQTLGLAPFDGSLKLSGSLPVTATGVTFTAGRFDQAALVDAGDQLVYDAAGYFDPAQGSVQMWVKTSWAGADNREHVFFEGLQAGGQGYRLRLAKADWNWLYAWFSDGSLGQHDFALYADVSDWQPEVWRHLALVWQPAQSGTVYRRFTLWVDGRLADSRVLRVPLAGMPTWLSIGAGVDGQQQAEAALDEVFISGVARVGNSQQTRLLVSQSGAHRVDVFDWLGQALSQFGGPGSGAGQFSAPQALLAVGPGGRTVLAADRGNGRIEALRFDGVNLTWQGHWATGLGLPQGLARLPGDAAAVSDLADNRIKLLTPAGGLLRSWSGPNDGHAGNFWQPLGVALLPSGDLLVTDTNNGRVVRIAGAVTLCYDFDGSGLVDVADIQAVAERWDGAAPYDARFDVIPDGVIDVVDVMTVAAQWGRACG